MKSLYEPRVAADMQERLARLRPDSQRQWGTMNAAQVTAHCAAAMEMAVGDLRPPRAFIGRLIGPMIVRRITSDDAPLRRNTPTAKELVIVDERDLERERARLRALIERFTASGPTSCTTHPHTFFGPMTPAQWSILMYKHLDHHLRQFGV